MKTSRLYLSDRKCLAWFHSNPTPEFWDDHWKILDLEKFLKNPSGDNLFIPAVKRYLLPGSSVLEAGCGSGLLVSSLHRFGYKPVGIDFANETIERINRIVPELDVRYGDIRKLDFPNNMFDGCISAGAIEHYWDGYYSLIREMHRVIRPGGFLFISFPYLSPIRKFKILLHLYRFTKSSFFINTPNDFYQFALDTEEVCVNLQNLGFNYIESSSVDGIKGFKDEVNLFRSFLQDVYDGKHNRKVKYRLNKFLTPFASHMKFLVMKKLP